MNHTPIVAASAHPLPRRKLPIGIQTFAKLREQNCYYVDKTALAMQLIDSGTYYFLSRPRRFGKSLFLDTLREMFEGKQALFKGLAAESSWDWSQTYPVIRISFSSGVLRNRSELDQRIREILRVKGGLAVPGPHISKLYKLLTNADFAGLKNLFHAFYASIANDWYRKNEMSHFEGYYVSIFYSYFAALGLHIQLEDTTNQGRIDMTVLFNHQVFLFEFKVVELNPAGKALQQIKDMAYADKFKARGEPIHLIGVEFSKASRNIVGFEVETL